MKKLKLLVTINIFTDVAKRKTFFFLSRILSVFENNFLFFNLEKMPVCEKFVRLN